MVVSSQRHTGTVFETSQAVLPTQHLKCNFEHRQGCNSPVVTCAFPTANIFFPVLQNPGLAHLYSSGSIRTTNKKIPPLATVRRFLNPLSDNNCLTGSWQHTFWPSSLLSTWGRLLSPYLPYSIQNQ